MSGTTEAFARVKIDALLKDAGWNLTDGSSVLFEHGLPDGTQADYVLCDRQGRPMAALEAKRASTEMRSSRYSMGLGHRSGRVSQQAGPIDSVGRCRHGACRKSAFRGRAAGRG